MFEISFERRGVAKFITSEAKTGGAQIKTCVRAALRTALVKYATGRLRGASLRDRMIPGAFQRYHFSRRDARYERQQIRRLGQLIPYYSPRIIDMAGLTIALTKGNAQDLFRKVADMANRYKPHLRDLVRVPGTGFTVRESPNSSRTVSAFLALPGARVLNRNKNGVSGAAYREELLDFSLGGNRDAMALWAEFFDQFNRNLALTTGKT